MSPTQLFLLRMRRALCLLGMLTVTQTVFAQVIYESGVNVVTVVGTAGIPGDRDGTGDQTLLGEVTGVAAISETGYAVSYVSSGGYKTKVKRIVGRTMSTIADFQGTERRYITGDPARGSLIVGMINYPSVSSLRLSENGQVITSLPFVAYCAIRGDSVGIPDDQKRSLSVLDLRTGNYTYLAGGLATTVRDGIGEMAGFNRIDSAAMADGLIYVNDYPNIRTVTLAGEVKTLVGGGGAYVDGDLASAKAFPTLPMVVDNDNNLIFVQNNSIRRLAKNTVKTLAGNPSGSGTFDGNGFNARFSSIQGIAIDSANRLWVADQNCVRLVTFQESRKDTAPQMGIRVVPGITVTGEVGGVYRIEYKDSLPGAGWQLLRVIVLAQPVEEFFDYEARGQERVYRVVVPQ